MRFDSEAKKLETIRQLLAKESKIELSQYAPSMCHRALKDLLEAKGFEAIEPVVRAESADDPALAKWRQCAAKYPENDEEARFFFHSFKDKDLGAPPYRYYVLDLDGNPENGPEDLIYHEMSRGPEYPLSITGYTWVDLERCQIKGGFKATGALTRRSRKPDAVYLNMLVRYRGHIWVGDYVDGNNFLLERRKKGDVWEICQWFLPRPE
jgi:hypothetical protein